MSNLRSVAAAAVAAAVAGGALASSPARGSDDTTDGSPAGNPIIEFVTPTEGEFVDGDLKYGEIQIAAWDPDVGDDDGDGIRSVTLTIISDATGKIVRQRRERRATYDFGAKLRDGVYHLEAYARSTAGAGGTASLERITITVGEAPPPTTAPPTTAPPTTAPPTTAPPTTAPPTTAPPTTAPPTTAPPTTAPPTTAPAGAPTEAAAASLELLNAERAAVGAPPLKLDTSMSEFALNWSQTMAASGFRHSDGPFAENIAWHSDTSMGPRQAAELFNQMWRDSPGHYANMTNASYTKVGIGLYQDASGWWATHVFS